GEKPWYIAAGGGRPVAMEEVIERVAGEAWPHPCGAPSPTGTGIAGTGGGREAAPPTARPLPVAAFFPTVSRGAPPPSAAAARASSLATAARGAAAGGCGNAVGGSGRSDWKKLCAESHGSCPRPLPIQNRPPHRSPSWRSAPRYSPRCAQCR